MPDERDELIAALRQLTAFTEGLLTLSERLVRAYDTTPARARPRRGQLDADSWRSAQIVTTTRPRVGGRSTDS